MTALGSLALLMIRTSPAIPLLLLAIWLGYLGFGEAFGGYITCGDHPTEYCIRRGLRTLLMAIAFGWGAACIVWLPRHPGVWLVLALTSILAIPASAIWEGVAVLQVTLVALAAGALIAAAVCGWRRVRELFKAPPT